MARSPTRNGKWAAWVPEYVAGDADPGRAAVELARRESTWHPASRPRAQRNWRCALGTHRVSVDDEGRLRGIVAVTTDLQGYARQLFDGQPHSGSAGARTVCSLEAARSVVASPNYNPRQHPIRRYGPAARPTDRRAPLGPVQSRSSSRTMTAMMSATIAMVRVFIRTSPSFCGALLVGVHVRSVSRRCRTHAPIAHQ